MAELATLKCPNCGSPLRSEDWDTAAGLITCKYCHTIISATKNPAAKAEDGFRERPEIPLPPGLSCEETPLGLVISRRWFSVAVFFLIPFCIAWDAFLVFWYSMAFQEHAPWIMKVFPVAHVAIGAGLSYFTLASLVNRTQVMAAARSLRISHGPLPWRGGVDVPSETVDQLYCKVSISNNRNGPSVGYEVWASFHDGTSRRLVSTGLNCDQALFIEQRIERALGIKDRVMAGEVPR